MVLCCGLFWQAVTAIVTPPDTLATVLLVVSLYSLLAARQRRVKTATRRVVAWSSMLRREFGADAAVGAATPAQRQRLQVGIIAFLHHKCGGSNLKATIGGR